MVANSQSDKKWPFSPEEAQWNILVDARRKKRLQETSHASVFRLTESPKMAMPEYTSTFSPCSVIVAGLPKWNATIQPVHRDIVRGEIGGVAAKDGRKGSRQSLTRNVILEQLGSTKRLPAPDEAVSCASTKYKSIVSGVNDTLLAGAGL
jgi:hypothetical protein